MKNRFGRILSLLCAIMLLASVVSVWAHAEQTPATPTDLDPAEEETIPATGYPEGSIVTFCL